MKKIVLLLIVLLSSHLWAANERVALVIGNAAYKSAPLRNPVNDAQDMTTKLRKLGFDVVLRTNLTTKQIGPTLREFRSKLSPGAVAVVFYAGHGVQIKGENYFPMVDAEITGEEDVPNQSLAVRQIMDILEESKVRLNLVFLDACRNNPYARSFRSNSIGLARLNAPSGTMISYATRPGSVAADGDGRNGLYTQYLLKAMDLSEPIELALKTVVTGVKMASRGSQEPWMEGSIEGNFSFNDTKIVQANNLNQTSVQLPTDSQLEEKFWVEVKATSNKASFEAYLEKYPNGYYAGLARANILGLTESKPDKYPKSGVMIGTISKIHYNYNYAEVLLLPNRNLKIGDVLIDENSKGFIIEKMNGNHCSIVPDKNVTFSGLSTGSQLYFRNN